jgi:hypothetical protein
LQDGEGMVELTHKECDRVVHKAKQFKWEDNNLFRVCTNGQVRVMPCPNKRESLFLHAHESFWGLLNFLFAPSTLLTVEMQL